MQRKQLYIYQLANWSKLASCHKLATCFQGQADLSTTGELSRTGETGGDSGKEQSRQVQHRQRLPSYSPSLHANMLNVPALPAPDDAVKPDEVAVTSLNIRPHF